MEIVSQTAVEKNSETKDSDSVETTFNNKPAPVEKKNAGKGKFMHRLLEEFVVAITPTMTTAGTTATEMTMTTTPTMELQQNQQMQQKQE